MSRLTLSALLALTACEPHDSSSAFPGLQPIAVEPVRLAVAKKECTWVSMPGYRSLKKPALPHALGDLTGEGDPCYAILEEREGEFFLAVKSAAGETLRRHPGSPWNHTPVLALPDLDGDGCAEYLLRTVSRYGWRIKGVSLTTLSGRTGHVLAEATWETPRHSPRVQGVFTVVGEPDRPLLLAFGKELRPRNAFRRGPRNQVVEGYAYLMDPLDFEPARFLSWKSFPKNLDTRFLFADWTGNGVAEWLWCSNGVFELRTTTSGERLRVREKRAQMTGYDDETGFARPVLLDDRVVFAGSGTEAVAALAFRNGKLLYNVEPYFSKWWLHEVESFLPVQDADGDGVSDLYVAARGLTAIPGRGEDLVPRVFQALSGATGKLLCAD